MLLCLICTLENSVYMVAFGSALLTFNTLTNLFINVLILWLVVNVKLLRRSFNTEFYDAFYLFHCISFVLSVDIFHFFERFDFIFLCTHNFIIYTFFKTDEIELPNQSTSAAYWRHYNTRFTDIWSFNHQLSAFSSEISYSTRPVDRC